MSDTISSFMHEINNPLSNIYMLVQVMEKETDIRSIKQYSGLIQQSIQQVKDLHTDFNEYRRTGKMSIKPSIVNIGSLLSGVVEEYRLTANKKNITITLNIKPCRVYTDAVKLRQVVSNLLSNAIKYNVVNGSIEIKCVYNNPGVDITISDTGIGMDLTELSQLGTPFYRCKRVEVPGTGLGFSLVKKIVNSLSWEINTTSELNKGTTVVLSVR